jgi:hypothetical protein
MNISGRFLDAVTHWQPTLLVVCQGAGGAEEEEEQHLGQDEGRDEGSKAEVGARSGLQGSGNQPDIALCSSAGCGIASRRWKQLRKGSLAALLPAPHISPLPITVTQASHRQAQQEVVQRPHHPTCCPPHLVTGLDLTIITLNIRQAYHLQLHLLALTPTHSNSSYLLSTLDTQVCCLQKLWLHQFPQTT